MSRCVRHGGRVDRRRCVDATSATTTSRCDLRRSAGRPPRVSASWLPPWPLTNTTPAAQSALRPNSIATWAITSVPIERVPAKPACSPEAVTEMVGPMHETGRAMQRPPGDLLGDEGVGVEREVRAVLLGRTDGDQDDRRQRAVIVGHQPSGRVDLVPRRLTQSHRRSVSHLPLRSVPTSLRREMRVAVALISSSRHALGSVAGRRGEASWG